MTITTILKLLFMTTINVLYYCYNDGEIIFFILILINSTIILV